MLGNTTWIFHDTEPIYLQLVNQLSEKILAEYFHSGKEFPTICKLAQDTGVNANTVERAYHVLYKENFIVKKNRRYQVNMSTEFITAKRCEVALTHVTNCMRHLIELGYSEKGRRKIKRRYSLCFDNI